MDTAVEMANSDPDRVVPSVLLVDDRPENLLALEGVLKPLGARLVKARSGEDALLHLLRETFAVILLDVQMPRLDGLQTAELIKQREQTRHIPIIFITALSRETAYIFKGYEQGAVAYPAHRGARVRSRTPRDCSLDAFGLIFATGLRRCDKC